jgi:hypothetical protein
MQALRKEQRRMLELVEWLAVAIGQHRIALAAPSRISP